ncbi:MAG: hypothetical protein NTU69_12120 [Proteobacteria bacterium]|nr:hypothetical protein [Pseudomonadota bacterium]
MVNMISIFLGIVFGSISYLVINFWMAPLLEYLKVKYHIASDIVFNADIFDSSNTSPEYLERKKRGQEKIRKHAAEILARYYTLPRWYRKYLKIVNESPVEASKRLIGLSNSDNYKNGVPLARQVRELLRMPSDE